RPGRVLRKAVEERLRLRAAILAVRAGREGGELHLRLAASAKANERERTVVARLGSEATVRGDREVPIPRSERARGIALAEVEAVRLREERTVRIRRRSRRRSARGTAGRRGRARAWPHRSRRGRRWRC